MWEKNAYRSIKANVITVSFIGGGNRKTIDLPQVTNKPYYIMLYTSPLPGL
jgi:hypothetical protein